MVRSAYEIWIRRGREELGKVNGGKMLIYWSGDAASGSIIE